MNLAADEGVLNLAGVLLFSEQPEWIAPQFVIKAIQYPGKKIHPSDYLDTEDFSGPLPKMFENALAFIMRNLHKLQAGRGVNMPGTPEIPEAVFEELLVNALVHRDYLVSAPIRLFIFDDRIEIISPGHLPDNLTVEKIKAGISNIRNPILVSYTAKGLLPYHGLGSGIKRALGQWPDIEFKDDRESCLFTSIIFRKKSQSTASLTKSSEKGSEKGSEKTEVLILEHLGRQPQLTIKELSGILGVSTRAVEKQIAKLKLTGRLERKGSRKQGYWNILKWKSTGLKSPTIKRS